MLRDVIELKQAALWHGGKVRIDQACEAAAEGLVSQPKTLRISFRSEEVRALSGTQRHSGARIQPHFFSQPILEPEPHRIGYAQCETNIKPGELVHGGFDHKGRRPVQFTLVSS